MNKLPYIIIISLILVTSSCEIQSGITKKSVEEYQATPTPARSPVPTPTPIDPADIVKADTASDGPMLSVNEDSEKKTINCDTYNRVMINGDKNEITIKGACEQVLFNGDGNNVSVNASSEYIFNGDNNVVTYAGYVNGKQFILTDNKKTNTVEKKAEDTKPTT